MGHPINTSTQVSNTTTNKETDFDTYVKGDIIDDVTPKAVHIGDPSDLG